MIFDEIMKCD